MQGLPPSEKAIYNEILKQEKQKSKVSNEKYTSTGEPLSLIQQREKEIQEAIELEDKNTTELVNLEVCNDSKYKSFAVYPHAHSFILHTFCPHMCIPLE